jgi:hypothetical protein
MKKLYVITLEKIEQRYTSQWYNQFKHYFSKEFQVIYIDGKQMSDKIKKGKFLDVNRTNMWKAVQVEQMATLFDEEKIKDGDRFLFADGWHFGVTALKYMAQLQKIKIKIFLYMHAGTWDKHDFISQAGLGKWARYDEIAWLKACDGIFVATKFHKELILSSYGPNWKDIPKKIHVVGFPMNWLETIEDNMTKESVVKEDLIVFPHRLDKEKQPLEFDKLRRIYPAYTFIKTLEVTKNKKEYYDLIKKAKIAFSASLQETYGIGEVESLILGCIPLVPDRLSYVEMYDKIFRYKDLTEAKFKIKYFMDTYDSNKKVQAIMKNNKDKLIKDSLDAFSKMSKVMNGNN